MSILTSTLYNSIFLDIYHNYFDKIDLTENDVIQNYHARDIVIKLEQYFDINRMLIELKSLIELSHRTKSINILICVMIQRFCETEPIFFLTFLTKNWKLFIDFFAWLAIENICDVSYSVLDIAIKYDLSHIVETIAPLYPHCELYYVSRSIICMKLKDKAITDFSPEFREKYECMLQIVYDIPMLSLSKKYYYNIFTTAIYYQGQFNKKLIKKLLNEVIITPEKIGYLILDSPTDILDIIETIITTALLDDDLLDIESIEICDSVLLEYDPDDLRLNNIIEKFADPVNSSNHFKNNNIFHMIPGRWWNIKSFNALLKCIRRPHKDMFPIQTVLATIGEDDFLLRISRLHTPYPSYKNYLSKKIKALKLAQM
jgi:hypothetical protein